MVTGVQNSSPKHPNPFPLQAAEERPLFEPPGRSASGKLRQSSLDKPDVLVDVRLDGRLLVGGKQFFDRRLRRADELSEETPLGKQLVDHDRADRVRFLMRLEV